MSCLFFQTAVKPSPAQKFATCSGSSVNFKRIFENKKQPTTTGMVAFTHEEIKELISPQIPANLALVTLILSFIPYGNFVAGGFHIYFGVKFNSKPNLTIGVLTFLIWLVYFFCFVPVIGYVLVLMSLVLFAVYFYMIGILTYLKVSQNAPSSTTSPQV